ncbi:MAG: efflux RND transporter periplasmic adaptor subunit [Planctomycetota bacterium]
MSGVDLAGLTIKDEAPEAIARRPIGPRLLGLAVIALALAVATTFLWPLLRPATAVSTAPVRLVSSRASAYAANGRPVAGRAETDDAGTSAPTSAGAAGAETVAEAVGWVEADPYATIVRPLVAGRIETLEVLEGAAVVAGETVIARLLSAELLARAERTEAQAAELATALLQAKASAERAERMLAQNAAARLRLSDAETKLTATATRLARAEETLLEQRAKAKGSEAALQAQQRLAQAGNSYEVALARARADREASMAAVRAAQSERDGIEREQQQLAQVRDLCRELVEAPVDLRGAAAVAAADVAHAEAALHKAQTEHHIAQRELDWAVVKAPVSGTVLRLESEPGDLVGPGHKGIVALYDPQQLRARIDVPLDSLTGIHAGQNVEITSEATGGIVVRGVVQRLQHETDLLKNTLQVKIGLIDPPPLLRPETLCRARFLATPRQRSAARDPADRTPFATNGAEFSTNALGANGLFLVPARAVQSGTTAEDDTERDVVFVYEPRSGTARGIAVKAAGTQGDSRIVRGALSPTQRVVLDAVSHGQRIAPRDLATKEQP